MSEFHPVVQQIRDLIESAGMPYEFFEHEPVRTSEEAQAQRPQYTMSQGAKALILRVKDREGKISFVQAVIPADRKLDSKKFKKILNAKSVSFANQEDSDEITGSIEFGGVPPFGNLFDLRVYADSEMLEHEEIIFNCGDRRASIAMRREDWQRLVNPELMHLT